MGRNTIDTKDREATTPYTLEEVATLLGFSVAQLRGYVRAGVIEPVRRASDGSGDALRFSFQDLVFLRVVKNLSTSRISPRRMRRALRSLRERLPEDQPLSALRILADGGELVVREGGKGVWSALSGQYAFDFGETEPTAEGGTVEFPDLPRSDTPVAIEESAEGWYVLANELEESDPAQARQAYERALELDPKHADAHVNLGCLEHEVGRLQRAEYHYRAALEARNDHAVAAFNLGVVLEDRRSDREACAAYSRALEADARLADAHYNLARILERLGDSEASLRHLRAYRALQQEPR